MVIDFMWVPGQFKQEVENMVRYSQRLVADFGGT